jgi:hypothetical protein
VIDTHFINRRFIGPDLNHITRDCGIIMNSHHNADPSKFDDNEWLSSTYTNDGKTIYGLVHEEFHGWEHPGMCPTQGSFESGCWYNAISLATSKNKGNSYSHATPPSQLVASVPYTYVPPSAPGTGVPYGVFEPSNTIYNSSDGYYYALLHLEHYQDQQVGVCAMRTRNLADPKSWRAWGGSTKGYSVTFTNPYTYPYSSTDPPSSHVCQPVSFAQIEKMDNSVTYNTHFNKYLLVGITNKYDPARAQFVYGVYYSTSSDLVNWSDRQLLMEAELPWSYQCGDADPIAYPSLLDPASTSRNFETTAQGSGHTTYLYFTLLRHGAPPGCPGLLDRDLLRIPIQFVP